MCAPSEVRATRGEEDPRRLGGGALARMRSSTRAQCGVRGHVHLGSPLGWRLQRALAKPDDPDPRFLFLLIPAADSLSPMASAQEAGRGRTVIATGELDALLEDRRSCVRTIATWTARPDPRQADSRGDDESLGCRRSREQHWITRGIYLELAALLRPGALPTQQSAPAGCRRHPDRSTSKLLLVEAAAVVRPTAVAMSQRGPRRSSPPIRFEIEVRARLLALSSRTNSTSIALRAALPPLSVPEFYGRMKVSWIAPAAVRRGDQGAALGRSRATAPATVCSTRSRVKLGAEELTWEEAVATYEQGSRPPMTRRTVAVGYDHAAPTSSVFETRAPAPACSADLGFTAPTERVDIARPDPRPAAGSIWRASRSVRSRRAWSTSICVRETGSLRSMREDFIRADPSARTRSTGVERSPSSCRPPNEPPPSSHCAA